MIRFRRSVDWNGRFSINGVFLEASVLILSVVAGERAEGSKLRGASIWVQLLDESSNRQWGISRMGQIGPMFEGVWDATLLRGLFWTDARMRVCKTKVMTFSFGDGKGGIELRG
jgi:hypothetical protein